MEKSKHVVYILRCKDSTLYTGYTNDLTHRLQMHTCGKGAKYTRGRGPFHVAYIERFSSKIEALKREYAIKRLTRSKKQQLIAWHKQEVEQNEDAKEL